MHRDNCFFAFVHSLSNHSALLHEGVSTKDVGCDCLTVFNKKLSAVSFITFVKLDTTLFIHVCERSLIDVNWFNNGN